jgi:hypothetical protein
LFSPLIAAVVTVLAAVPAAAQVTEAAVIGEEWLGPHPDAIPRVAVRRPFWQGPGAMTVEAHEAQRVIRSWWPATIADPQGAAIIDGFAWYLQTLAVERAFDARYLRTAHSVESRPYLGDHIIWSFPALRLSRHAVAERNRYAAVFAALERWIGLPQLQGAMFEVARLHGERLNASAIIETMSAAAGQDLSWAFTAAASGVEVNYKVMSMTSREGAGCPAPCVQTDVTVAREGDGIFPGRTAPRIGEFQSGDALLLTVTFADETQSSVRWDGRDTSRVFTFVGRSPAVAAHLDPDRVVTVDRNRLDNAIVRPAATNVPVTKWAARWMVWLQHTMLSYGFFA